MSWTHVVPNVIAALVVGVVFFVVLGLALTWALKGDWELD